MDLPVKKFEPTLDFFPFVRLLEKKHGFDFHDMAGKYSAQQKRREELLKEYGYSWDVWGKKPPAEMDENEKAFHEVYKEAMKEANFPPYENTWHWLIRNDFDELNREGINYLGLYEEDDENIPAYVRRFKDLVRQELLGTEFEGDKVAFYVDR